jgi:hypothetical protein
MSTVKENLIAAKALIDTPEKWIKGSFHKAGCFCAVGALGMASNGNPENWGYDEREALLRALPVDAVAYSVALFNDDPDTTHADIMALFDRAIAAQDGQP